MKAQRQTNLEILRILCMLFIVTGHVNAKGDIPSFVDISPHSVNCFVLISGYFLINAKFKSERILRTFIETIFYSFTITIILYFCGKANLYDVAKSAMPFAPTKFSYWFVNKYLAIILLSPFISKVCTAISKKQYKILLITLLLINSTLFLVFPFGELFGNGFSLLWMTTVFITGGYMRLHTPEFKYWGFTAILLLVLYNVCRSYLNNVILLGYNSLITYALGITTFMWFKNLQIPNNGIIAKTTMFIAPHVFAVYLIHSQGLISTYLIDILRKFNGYMPEIPYLYLFGFSIIVLSAVIDKVRMVLFKRTGIDYLTNRIAAKLDKSYQE